MSTTIKQAIDIGALKFELDPDALPAEWWMEIVKEGEINLG